MSELSSIEENVYYWKVDNENVIERIVIDYSSYVVHEMYRETNAHTKIKNYELDCSGRLYLLNRYKNGANKKFYLKIIDIQHKKVLYNIQVNNKDIIGQFLSGNFYIINGIFYFQNNIIKINFPNIIGLGEEL